MGPPVVKAQLVLRRTYVESSDFLVTVRSMSKPEEVLVFMAEHSDADTRTHEAALRALGRLATPDLYNQVVEDGRFHALLSALAGRLEDCDARMLSMIADASARFRSSTPELSELAQRLAEVIIRREDAFSPRSLANVAIALAVRGVRDVTTVEFIRAEAFKLMDDMEPSHCVTLLEAFRRWGVFDRQLVDLVVERMCDEVDRFAARDVVDALAVISRLGLPRGFLLRRLCSLSFENLNQFTPRELTKMAYSLGKLRFLTQGNIDDLADALKPKLDRLSDSQVTEFLYALAMTDARHQNDLARTMVLQYVKDDIAAGPSKSLGSLIDFAWSLCALDLVDEKPENLKAALTEIFNRKPPQNRVPLMKLFDVFCAMELRYKALGVSIPPEWKAACDDADRFEMDRLESSRLHNEIVMRFDHLRGTANGTRWQLRMSRNQMIGPYRVDMMDEETKIGLDVETVSWPTSRKLKHKLLQEGEGAQLIRIDYWDWRRARTEEDQNAYLQQAVGKLLEA